MFTCPSVDRTIKGMTFSLCMNFHAIALAEKHTGKNFLDAAVWDSMDVTTITVLFWAGAVQNDTRLKLEEVRRFGFADLPAIVEACRVAWKVASEVPAEDARPTSGSEWKAIEGSEV